MSAPIDQLLSTLDWQAAAPPENPGHFPYATHSGVLTLLDKPVRCYRLSTGEVVFDADDFKVFFEGAFPKAAKP